MDDYKIVGLSQPNKVKLSSGMKGKIIEMSIRATRNYMKKESFAS